MPGAPAPPHPPQCKHQNCLQTRPNVLWGVLKLLLQTHQRYREQNPGYRARWAGVQIPTQPPNHLRGLRQGVFFLLLFIQKERLTIKIFRWQYMRNCKVKLLMPLPAHSSEINGYNLVWRYFVRKCKHIHQLYTYINTLFHISNTILGTVLLFHIYIMNTFPDDYLWISWTLLKPEYSTLKIWTQFSRCKWEEPVFFIELSVLMVICLCTHIF